MKNVNLGNLGRKRIDDDILDTERARRVNEVGDEYIKYKEDDDDEEDDYYISSDEKGFKFVNKVEHEWIDVYKMIYVLIKVWIMV
jgi:hypothetical protein